MGWWGVLLWAWLHDGGDLEDLLVALDVEVDGASDGGGECDVVDFFWEFEGFAVDADDDVVWAEAGFCGGGVGDDFVDGDAEFAVCGAEDDFVCDDAEEADGFGALFEDGFCGGAGVVGWDGEADALPGAEAFVALVDGEVDADDLAVDVDEWAAGVAWVDDGVCLEDVEAVLADAFGADDALGEGAAEAEGVADGEDGLADFDVVGVGEGECGEGLLGVLDLDDGDVCFGVDADEGGFVGFLVVGGDADFECVGDDVVVGEDVAFWCDDDAGAEAGDDLEAAGEAAEAFFLEVLAVDADDGWEGALGEGGDFLVEVFEGGGGGIGFGFGFGFGGGIEELEESGLWLVGAPLFVEPGGGGEDEEGEEDAA